VPPEQRSSRPSPRPHLPSSSKRRPGSALARTERDTGAQLVATAGSAIVTAARVGRLLGRSGWRIAKQIPGVSLVEQQAQRLRHAASAELLRLLEMPQQYFSPGNSEEQRVMMLVQNAGSDPAPLRTAMSELLSRASESTAGKSREYLFGTIVSQLVPDEARVLAALAEGKRYATVDVVAKHVGRSSMRTVFSNASLIGAAAGISPARNVATYLSRLHGLGLVEFGPSADELGEEYDQLAVDAAVQDARAFIDRNKMGSARLIRKSVALSQLGQDFWTACAPDRSTLSRLRG
jgi:Abortive infection alpha